MLKNQQKKRKNIPIFTAKSSHLCSKNLFTAKFIMSARCVISLAAGYLPIQRSGLSLEVSLRNWKWRVARPAASVATLPSVWRAVTF